MNQFFFIDGYALANSAVESSVVDPHWFQCGCGSCFLFFLFYANVDPNLGNQINADLDPGQTLKLQQFEYLNEKCT
jgi:hypothetical protein